MTLISGNQRPFNFTALGKPPRLTRISNCLSTGGSAIHLFPRPCPSPATSLILSTPDRKFPRKKRESWLGAPVEGLLGWRWGGRVPTPPSPRWPTQPTSLNRFLELRPCAPVLPQSPPRTITLSHFSGEFNNFAIFHCQPRSFEVLY